MPVLTFLVAGPLDARTGGSIYNRRIAGGLSARGWSVHVEELDASFPFPTADALACAAAALARAPDDALVVVDGLAYSVMADVVAPASRRLNIVALVHLPFAATIGLDSAQAERAATAEQLAFSHARRLIVTGPHAVTLMKVHGLTHPDVIAVEPGTDPAPLSTGSGSGRVHLLTVATLNAGKGHEQLLEALAMLPHRRFHLSCGGSTTRDPEAAARVRAAIERLQLAEQVSLLGELDEHNLAAAYGQADVFVLASLRETYGMAVAEALARGLPVVGTMTGAIPALVGEDAGLVVPPGDVAALSNALRRMIDDSAFRARCAGGARRVRKTLPTWDDAAARFADALDLSRHG